MKLPVTAIFDIGKTNKKFLLFDTAYQLVYHESITLEEISDEDGFATEDLSAILNWMHGVLDHMLGDRNFDIQYLNFSTYGASLVHLDENDQVLTPLYNYLKPIEEEITTEFYQKYGPEAAISKATGSPKSGMLNSGLQLYWLKYKKPEIFKQIKYSLHLPQYLSFVFTGTPVSEYSSIGCHTMLWDYAKSDYHAWVYLENLDKILASIVSTKTRNMVNYRGKELIVGVGIHDSSASLLPYLNGYSEPFALLSTGTWSVTMNPFSTKLLTEKDIQQGGINYMSIDETAVRASRLMLGKEYDFQVGRIKEHYHLPINQQESISFNRDIFDRISKENESRFKWKYLSDPETNRGLNLSSLNFEEALHQLIMELVQEQVKSIETAVGGTNSIRTIIVDGGFNNNDLFMHTLALCFDNYKIFSAHNAVGTALGAAMVMSSDAKSSSFDVRASLTEILPNTAWN